MCYMMSKQQYLSDHDKNWHPHLMWFVPGDAAKSWGANLPGSPVLAADDPEDRMTIFLVWVGNWSDGTQAMHRPVIRWLNKLTLAERIAYSLRDGRAVLPQAVRNELPTTALNLSSALFGKAELCEKYSYSRVRGGYKILRFSLECQRSRSQWRLRRGLSRNSDAPQSRDLRTIVNIVGRHGRGDTSASPNGDIHKSAALSGGLRRVCGQTHIQTEAGSRTTVDANSLGLGDACACVWLQVWVAAVGAAADLPRRVEACSRH
jgi:hypothetical protein